MFILVTLVETLKIQPINLFVLGNTGHIEAAEINYDSSLVNEEQLVKLLFLNIDPFDEGGQFCDRGYSYKSAFFTSDENLIKIINNYISKNRK